MPSFLCSWPRSSLRQRPRRIARLLPSRPDVSRNRVSMPYFRVRHFFVPRRGERARSLVYNGRVLTAAAALAERCMATEIERKFRALDDGWRRDAAPGVRMRQGYLSGGEQSSIRVRVQGDEAFLNIKSATLGVRRHEYEYAIPRDDDEEMLDLLCARPLIDTERYELTHAEHVWEVDVFECENAGLVVAEIELASEDVLFV